MSNTAGKKLSSEKMGEALNSDSVESNDSVFVQTKETTLQSEVCSWIAKINDEKEEEMIY